MKSRAAAQLLKGASRYYPGGNVHHRHARNLAYIGHGAGGTGIDLDNIKLVIVYKILNVYESSRSDRQRKLFGALHNTAHHFIVNAERRIHRNRIAAVYARTLNVLHYPGDENVLSVRDNVDFQFLARHILVNENRIIDSGSQNTLHINPNLVLIMDDFHILSADNV